MHEIMEHDKQQGTKQAWHGLTDVKEDLSLANCWLGTWDYIPRRLTTEDGTKTPFFILGASDVPDLVIGKAYDPDTFKPAFNAKLIELLSKVTDGKDIELESCGTVKNRGRQFFSFRLGDSYRAAGRDFVPYFNIGNGNDQSSPVWQNTSTTCTVCNNTFQMNMGGAGLVMSVKKTKYSEIKMGDFYNAARNMLASQKEFARQLDALATIKTSEDDARAFFAGYMGEVGKAMGTRTQNIVDRLVTLFKTGAGNSGENLSDVFSAITDYFTHESASSEDDGAAKWKNFVSSEFGTARNKKVEVWTILNDETKRNGFIALGRDILKLTAQAS